MIDFLALQPGVQIVVVLMMGLAFIAVALR